jgi:hypothetical protein
MIFSVELLLNLLRMPIRGLRPFGFKLCDAAKIRIFLACTVQNIRDKIFGALSKIPFTLWP